MPAMGEISQAGHGIFASIKGLVKTLISIGQNRLELLLVELQEERWRFFEALLLTGFVLILALLTLLVVVVTIVVMCVQAHNYLVIGILVGVCLLGTLLSLWQLRNLLKNWAPFSATLSEIKKDKEWLEGKN